MGSTKTCKLCKKTYNKKLIKCPSCGKIDDRRIEQIRSLEHKVYQHPEIGLCCKKCGTLYPNDIPHCTYCGASATDAGRPVITNGSGGKFDTPITRYFGVKPYNIIPNSKTKIAAAKNIPSKLVACECCGGKLSSKAETCPHCGNPTGVHLCPRCTSNNTAVITSASKTTSVLLWGAFAANKVVSKFECKDCGHKF